MSSWSEQLRGIEHVGRDQEGALRRASRATAASSTASVVRICHSTWSGGASLRGRPGRRCLGCMTSTLCDLQPRGALLELRAQGGLGVGHTGEALVAQVPERLLPLLPGVSTCRRSVARARSSPCVVRTTTQRSPAGAAVSRRPEQVARPAARRRRQPPAPRAPAWRCRARD